MKNEPRQIEHELTNMNFKKKHPVHSMAMKTLSSQHNHFTSVQLACHGAPCDRPVGLLAGCGEPCDHLIVRLQAMERHVTATMVCSQAVRRHLTVQLALL